MSGRVIVINGGSSSGKSSVIRRLQATLRESWLGLSIDTFVDALPARLTGAGEGIEFQRDGTVDVGPEFMALENAWKHGIAAMARAGASILIDDVFLGGPHSQGRWRAALVEVPVLWVGVRCDPDVAEERERGRGDRIVGMARQQSLLVHHGVEYDLEVDTSRLSVEQAAAVIGASVEAW